MPFTQYVLDFKILSDTSYYCDNLDEAVGEQPDFDETIINVGFRPGSAIHDANNQHHHNENESADYEQDHRAIYAGTFCEWVEDDQGDQKRLNYAEGQISIEKVLLIIR